MMILAQVLVTVCSVALGASPKGPPKPPGPVAVVAPELASVLLAEAPALSAGQARDPAALSAGQAPDAKKLVEAYNKTATAAATLDEKSGGIVLPGVGRATVRLVNGVLSDADGAFRRGITSLISDEVLAPHVAQWVIEVVPDAGVARLKAVDALALLATVACRQNPSAIGVYFAAGRVVQPATYVLAAAKDGLPRGWLWVGFELGGTTTELHFGSIGLSKAGLMELDLVSARRDVGAAIETFFQLITLALGRDKDFADGFEIARTGAAPLVVKYAGEGGARVWRVDYTPPAATKTP